MSNVMMAGASGTAATKNSTSFVDDLMTVLSAPMKVISGDTGTYHSENVLGMAAVVWGLAGFAAGDKWGASVPFLGGRR